MPVLPSQLVVLITQKIWGILAKITLLMQQEDVFSLVTCVNCCGFHEQSTGKVFITEALARTSWGAVTCTRGHKLELRHPPRRGKFEWPDPQLALQENATKRKIISGQGTSETWVHLLISEGTEDNSSFKNHLALRETRDPNLLCGNNRIEEDEEEDVDEILSVHYYLLKVKGLQSALEGKGIDA